MPDIAIVGEAWGEQEQRQRAPFVGPSGQELTRMLSDAGIRRADCFLTNVFNLHPVKNDIETLCVPRSDDQSGLPALRPGKYIRREYLPELDRLFAELSAARPNLTIALGNTAAWALLHNPYISKIRGTVNLSVKGNFKVLPAYHPAAILRQWDLRAVTVLDFIKAKRESTYPDIRRLRREVWIEPSLEDIKRFYNEHVLLASMIAPDIETNADQITCIGFATSKSLALVIPFVDMRKGGSYWRTLEEERAAWDWVRKILASPAPKVFQNGLYDIPFLWRGYGITVNNAVEDTMLAQHALQPELPKGLDSLGSYYTDEAPWKLIHKRNKTIKRED